MGERGIRRWEREGFEGGREGDSKVGERDSKAEERGIQRWEREGFEGGREGDSKAEERGNLKAGERGIRKVGERGIRGRERSPPALESPYLWPLNPLTSRL